MVETGTTRSTAPGEALLLYRVKGLPVALVEVGPFSTSLVRATPIYKI